MERIRLGIIGIGHRGKALIRATQAAGQADIIALADPLLRARREGTKLADNAQMYERWEDMIGSERLDGVVIALPNHLHCDAAVAALRENLSVFCEKPIAPSIAEVDQIAAAAQQSKGIFQVGLEFRYAPWATDLARALAQGIIGIPKMMWCHEFRPPFRYGEGGWRMDKQLSGGTFLEKTVHHFDLFNWFSGSKPLRVYAVGENDTIYSDKTILDRAWVIVEYENRMSAQLGLCLFYHRKTLQLGLLGTEGSVQIDGIEKVVDIESRFRSIRWSYNADGMGTSAGNFEHPGEVEQQVAFAEAVRTGCSPVANLTVARGAHVLSAAAEQAVETGKVVVLSE